MVSQLLSSLNDKQLEAVTSPLNNILVLAGAGSGKTRVLVTRIAWLLQQGALYANEILAVTFTNKATVEMKERLNALLPGHADSLWVGTFHGICHRLLRRHHLEVNLPPQFHIIDSDDQVRMIKRVIASMGLDPEKWPAKLAQGFINAKKDLGLRPAHIDASFNQKEATLLAIYKAYEKACQMAGSIDFGEILLRAHELLRDNPQVLQTYQNRFKALLVDEFQDTNTIQYAFIRLLAGSKASVMVVGDDDQSIYGWRGACIENIQQFVDDFKPVTLVRLEQNYRSTETILQAANALIANNGSRMGKELWTDLGLGEKITVYKALNELEEAFFVARHISESIRQGHDPLDIAILYRSNVQSRVVEDALLRSGIAYRIYGGMRFYERAEVKDCLSYLRLLLNPNDDSSFERIVNFPTRGIGDKTLEELSKISKSEACSLWQASEKLIHSSLLSARAHSALMGFTTLISQLKETISNLELDEQIETVIQKSGLLAHYSKIKTDNSESKLENLQELITAAREFRFANNIHQYDNLSLLAEFLANTFLEAPERDSALAETQDTIKKGYVHLMTLHAAKGLEFPKVYLIGMEEGVFPSSQSQSDPKRLEEERRLCYVGLTRAKERIILSYAEMRRQYGRAERHLPSRFLKELPTELLEKTGNAQLVKKPMFNRNSMAAESALLSGFNLGQEVSHATFGSGVILAVEGSGENIRIEVKFEDSSKWLVLKYAKLTPLVRS